MNENPATPQFDVFLSHNHVDKPWVAKLKDNLLRYGVSVWLDKDEIRPGDLFVEVLGQALDNCRTVAIIVSPEAMVSGWVKEEYIRAVTLANKKNSPVKIIPLILRDAKLYPFLESRHWVDFRDETAYALNVWQLVWGITGKKPPIVYPAKAPTPKDPMEPVFWSPRPPAKIFGRKDLVQNLKRKLFTRKNLALVGLPGVGKTTLASELAYDKEVWKQNFKHGVLWASLGKEPDLITQLNEWGDILGILEKIAFLSEIEDMKEIIKKAIGLKHILIIIDDAWEPEAARHFFELGGPNCVYVVTTRFDKVARGLGISIEEVPELSETAGLELLGQFVPIAVETEPDKAKELVHLVGGLPLILNLIGARLSKVENEKQPYLIRRELERLQEREERLQLEGEKPIIIHPSIYGAKISLQAVISLSDEALEDESRDVLRALSIFPPKPNTFPQEAALAVSATTIETLEILVDNRLLEHIEKFGGLDIRYTLHPTIADYYADLKLTNSNIYERFIEFFTKFVETYKANDKALAEETSNIFWSFEMAFKRELWTALVQGVEHFYPFLLHQGLYEQAEALLSRAQQTAQESGDMVGLVKILLAQGNTALKRTQYTQAEIYFQEGLILARKIGDDKTRSMLLMNLGRLAKSQGNYTRAEAYLQEGLILAREIKENPKIGALLINLGELAIACGNYEQAENYLSESREIAQKLQSREGAINVMINLGILSIKRGDYEQAEKYLWKSLDLVENLEKRLDFLSNIFINYGEVAAYFRDYAKAEEFWKKSLELGEQIQDQVVVSYSLKQLGKLALYLEDYEQAYVSLQKGLDLARQTQQKALICSLLVEWGEYCLKVKKWEAATSVFQEALNSTQQSLMKEERADALYGLARVAKAQNDNIKAQHLGQESLSIFESMGHYKTIEVKDWLTTLS